MSTVIGNPAVPGTASQSTSQAKSRRKIVASRAPSESATLDNAISTEPSRLPTAAALAAVTAHFNPQLDAATKAPLPYPTLRRGSERGNEKQVSGPVKSVMQRIRLNAYYPLLSTLIIIGIAGIITSYLVDATRARPKLPSGIDIDVSKIDAKVIELQRHLQKVVNNLVIQIDTTNAQVKKLESSQALHESIDVQRFNKVEKEIHSLASKLAQLEPGLQDMVENGKATLRKEVEELITHAVMKVSLQQPNNDQSAVKENLQPTITIEDVRMAAKELLEEELRQHEADGIGIVDYALASGGGRVINHSETVNAKSSMGKTVSAILGIGNYKIHPLAGNIIEPSTGVPGRCLPLRWSNGTVDLALRTTILPQQISLEHVAESVAYDITSAPKVFRVFGWKTLKMTSETDEKPVPVLLGEFEYKRGARVVQTFRVLPEVSQVGIDAVRLQILSNHGSLSHTCVYRLRVHGTPVE